MNDTFSLCFYTVGKARESSGTSCIKVLVSSMRDTLGCRISISKLKVTDILSIAGGICSFCTDVIINTPTYNKNQESAVLGGKWINDLGPL